MKKTKLVRDRGEARPSRFIGPHSTIRFIDRHDNARTRVCGPHGMEGGLEFGPTAPGPFGEVIGHIDESKVVIRYRPWGSVEPARPAFEIRFEGTEYVLVARGRRPTPQLEDIDGQVLARFGKRVGSATRSLNPDEEILVALIAGSGVADTTMPQSWSARR